MPKRHLITCPNCKTAFGHDCALVLGRSGGNAGTDAQQAARALNAKKAGLARIAKREAKKENKS